MQRSLDLPPPVPPRPGHESAATRLHQLLQLVGADLAPALLVQLRADLCDCADRIAAAQASLDWDSLRDASHILISLSGSAGADRLHDLARDLNAAAHARDSGALTGLLPDLAAEQTALLALIETTSARGAPA